MTNKKQIFIRLGIFLLLSFGMTFAMFFIYILTSGWTINSSWYGVISSAAMFCPAIANILTRLITKEGFSGSLFVMKFKGNIRYIAFALIFSVVCSIITALCTCIFLLPSGSLEKMTRNIDIPVFLSTILYVTALSIISMLPGFGEEFGWRGYLTPKLEKLMPFPAAIVISGIIWGLWHAPIVACGHNFGTNYAGFPWLGIILMCISCIGFGLYPTALTRITGSVLTASIAHISINNIIGATSGAMLMSVDGYESISEKLSSGIEYPLLTMIVLFVMSITAGMVLLIIKKRKTKNTVSDNSKVKE